MPNIGITASSVVISSASFMDDFQRANGSPGPDWAITGKVHGSGNVDILQIDSGDLRSHVGSGTWYTSARRTTNYAGTNQFIEISISRVGGSLLEYIELYTRLSDNFTNVGAYVYKYDGIPLTYGLARYDGPLSSNWWDINAEQTMTMPADPLKLRVESDIGGALRFYINDALVCSGIDNTYPAGPYVGMCIQEGSSHLDLARGPRIHYASGGSF